MRCEIVKFSIPPLSKSFQKNISHPNILRFFGIRLQVPIDLNLNFIGLMYITWSICWGFSSDFYHPYFFWYSSFLSMANQLRWLLICYKWAYMAALALKRWRMESIKSSKKKGTCWYKITTKKWFLSHLLIRDKMKAWWQEWRETGEISSCDSLYKS